MITFSYDEFNGLQIDLKNMYAPFYAMKIIKDYVTSNPDDVLLIYFYNVELTEDNLSLAVNTIETVKRECELNIFIENARLDKIGDCITVLIET